MRVCTVCGCDSPPHANVCQRCRRIAAKRKKGLPCQGDVATCSKCEQEFVHSARSILNLGKESVLRCDACSTISRKENVRAFRCSNPSEKFRHLLGNATSRGIEVGITQEFYEKELLNKPCMYCGDTVIHAGSGVDRIDSEIGYVEGNVVPCCPTCNNMKNTLSKENMLQHMLKVLRHNGGLP